MLHYECLRRPAVFNATARTRNKWNKMKTIHHIRNLLTLATAVGFMAGCASDNYKNGANTAATLTASSGMVANGTRLIDESLTDLNDLISNPDPDLRKQFNKFNHAVHELVVFDKDVASNAGEMRAQGVVYFANWDKESAQIQNEDIRNRSEARRKEVAARFDRISQQYDQTEIAFKPFMSDLRDVQTFLSTDLTAGGLAAIKETVAKATKDAVPLKESLAKLSEEFKSMGLSMEPIAPSR